jgi:hypothetical protein
LVIKPASNLTYQWSTGEQASTISVNITGEYGVVVANGRCSVADEVYLQFTAVKDLRMQEAYLEGEYGEDILISAKGSNVDFWHWTLGDGLEVTTNEPSGTHRRHLLR